MIIDGPDSVTPAVLDEIARAANPRFREVMTALVKHLHAFIREAKLTEEEFHQGCAILNAIGQNSNSFHNEAVLMSGSLGVSTLELDVHLTADGAVAVHEAGTFAAAIERAYELAKPSGVVPGMTVPGRGSIG